MAIIKASIYLPPNYGTEHDWYGETLDLGQVKAAKEYVDQHRDWKYIGPDIQGWEVYMKNGVDKEEITYIKLLFPKHVHTFRVR
jgi:hypothetical protein